MCAIGTLDASLRLRGMGIDHFHAQLLENSLDIGMASAPGMVDGAKIDVKLAWNAVALDVRPEREQNIVGVLRLGKTHEDTS